MGIGIARLTGVKKSYGGATVLANVDLQIDTPQIVAIVGASGSGKSTLLHLLGGLDRRYEGRVEVLGRDLATLDEAELGELRNRQLGFVFQQFNLLDHLSVDENVALPALFSSDSAKVQARVAGALDRVGLAHKRSARPSELSGGQKQRVAIARAIVTEPKLLLADEPTGNLDGKTGDEILDLFAELARGGLTIVVVTHAPHVWQRAQRVFELVDGKLTERAAS